MSSSPRRGRKVQPAKKSSPLRTFYIVAAVVVIAGAALLITFATGQEEQPTATLPNTTTSGEPAADGFTTVPTTTVNYQTGKTPEGFHYKGSPDAPVTVVEYADFQCPACGNFANSSLYQNLNANYIATGQVHYIFHDFPLSYHDKAPLASQAAYCAGDQGQYWAMHDAIFVNQNQWSEMSVEQFTPYLSNIAQQLGLDMQAFQTCLTSGKYAAHVNATYQASVNAGIPATPTFVVDGQQVNASELQVAIDQALAAKGGS
jgi:protein-disulfide isomerase